MVMLPDSGGIYRDAKKTDNGYVFTDDNQPVPGYNPNYVAPIPAPAPSTPQQQTTTPTLNGREILYIVPGEQGRADAVVYRNVGGDPSITELVPDPQGHLDAQGNPVPGSKNVSLTPAEQAIITGYVKKQGLPENIDANKLTYQLPKDPVFKPTGNKVRIDNMPQGGDFAATRNYLLTLPTGTQVQIGESSNDNVYVWNGGLVEDDLDYYIGYGGVTGGMADEARRLQQQQQGSSSGPYSNPSKSMPKMKNYVGKMLDQPAYKPTSEDKKMFSNSGDDTVYINGVPLSPALSKLTRFSSDANKYIGEETDKFALGLGPVGSSRNEIGTFLGMGMGIPTGLLQLGVDAAALYEVYKKNPTAAQLQIAKNLNTNIPAFKESMDTHPGATWTMFALGAYSGLKAPLTKSRAFNTATDNVIKENIRSGVADSSGKVVPGSSKYGSRFTGEKPNTKFDTSYVNIESKGSAGGRARASAYDNGKKINNVFESPSGEVYADLVNEQAGGEVIPVKSNTVISNEGIKIEPLGTSTVKTIEVNKNIRYTPSDRPVLRPFKDTDMNWAKAQEGISINIGNNKKSFSFKDNMKDFFDNDKGSAQLLEPLERLRSKSKTVDEMVYNPAIKRTGTLPKTRLTSPSGGLIIGSTGIAGYTSSMISASKSQQGQKQRQIIGPGPAKKVTSTDISITNLIGGTSQKQKPYTGTGGYRPPKTNAGTDTAMALAFGAGVAGFTMSRMATPSRLRSVGGDMGGSYRKLFGSGMNKQKYQTGDVTSLLFGKKKKKAKRR